MDPRVHREVRSLRARIDLIAERINLSVLRPQKNAAGQEYMLVDLSRSLVRGCAQHGDASEIEPIHALFDYVKNNIEYRQDPSDYDYFTGAGRIITSGAGDCDEHTILQCSLLSAIGYRTGARVISENGNGWHIYALAGIKPAFNGSPTEVIPLDSAYGSEPGWQPDMRYRKHEFQCTFKAGKAIAWRKNR